jgi:hypothetical protein
MTWFKVPTLVQILHFGINLEMFGDLDLDSPQTFFPCKNAMFVSEQSRHVDSIFIPYGSLPWHKKNSSPCWPMAHLIHITHNAALQASSIT